MAWRASSPHRARPAQRSGSHAGRDYASASGGDDPRWALGARFPASRFARDDAGALLILTGVLLVLGFVIIGTTLVQLNAQEDKAARAQKETLLESVDNLVGGFSNSVASAVELGDTDITDFLSTSAMHTALFRDTATHTGLYANATLNPNPALPTYAGPDKCEVYDPVASTGGVIIGYEKETLRETIVGAVYTMEFTDGRQTVTMDYYVKIHECTGGILHSFPEGVDQRMGSIGLPLDPLKDADDAFAAVALTEELTGNSQQAGTADVAVLGSVGQWGQTGELHDGDPGSSAKHPGTAVPLNYVRTRIDHSALNLDELAPPVVINDLTFDVLASDVDGPLTNDDRLVLRLYKNDTTLLPFFTYDFPALPATATLYSIPVGDSPSGNPEWTLDEIDDVVVEVSVQVELASDPSHEFHVYELEPKIVYTSAVRHAYEIEFEWQEIPDIYTDHSLTAVYSIEDGTLAETFQFQVCQPPLDSTDNCKSWVDLGAPLANTGGAWLTWEQAFDPVYLTGNETLFRLIDLGLTDNLVDDRDVIRFDFFAVASTVDL